MDVTQDMVCRFCLGVSPKEFLPLNDSLEQMIDMLSVKMNLAVSDNPLVCEDCLMVINKSFSFKSVCMDLKENISLFDAGRRSDICRFCLQKVEEGSFMPLDALMIENTFSDMLKEYVPQMDLNAMKNPLICFYCRDNMENYFKFLHTCCDTEEKINKHQQNTGISGAKIMLGSLFETVSKYIKEEETNNPLMEIKGEFDRHEENSEKTNNCTLCEEKYCDCFWQSERSVKNAPHTEDLKIETENLDAFDPTFKIETGELVIKDDLTVHECTDQQRNFSAIYSCNTNREVLPRNNPQFEMYRYESCESQTEHEHSLNTHLLIHEDSSNVQMYQCDYCQYQTRIKANLKGHSLMHKDPSVVQMHQCNSCDYQTKYRSSFKTHLLTHKDFSDVQMNQCDHCDFQTVYKNSLRRHLLMHKDSSDVQMYQCDSCKYQTKQKSNIKTHMLTHKDSSDVHMYQCDSCMYQTKRKTNLKIHMLTHKDSSDIQMYHCNNCRYETKQKINLKTHMLIHKNSSDVQMFQCGSCKYQAKQKINLKTHMLTHKDSSDVQMYQCDSCRYQTKHKNNLKSHMLVHKNSSEVQMYQCISCEFQTKHKNSLKAHRLNHKHSSDVQIYQCDSCKYQTKHKHNFNRHLLKHSKSS